MRDVKNIIADGDIEPALKLLEEQAKGLPIHSDIIMLLGEYNRYIKEKRIGVLTEERIELGFKEIQSKTLHYHLKLERSTTFPDTKGTSIRILDGINTPLKENIAIILEVGGIAKCLPDVKVFLEDNSMEMTTILVTSKKPELDNNSTKDFESFIKDFKNLIKWIHNSRTGVIELHLFLAIPSALALGVGSVFRNLMPFKIYNYSRQTKKYTLIIRSEHTLGR
jgi:hypothetical protein